MTATKRLCGAALLTLAAAAQLSGCNRIDREVTLNTNINFWQSAPFNDPAVSYEDAWLSVPLRTTNGFVLGVARQGQQNVLLKIEERSGRVMYRQPLGALLQSYVRVDTWRSGELHPDAPMMVEGFERYLLAYGNEWALVDPATGNIDGHGTFPTMIPAVSPVGGLCAVGNGFWIAVQDGRDGGVMLAANGVLGSERAERPASCVAIADGSGDDPFPVSASPMQNARHSSVSYPSLCQGRRSTANRWCSSRRSDSTNALTVVIKSGSIVFKDAHRWTTVSFPFGYQGRPDFTIYPEAIELSSTAAFVSWHRSNLSVTQINAAPTSFQQNQTISRWTNYELVASISPNGALHWSRVLSAIPSASSQPNERWKRHSLLFTSHAASPTQNVYVFKPGMLLAVDQQSGVVQWRVGRPFP